MMSDIKEDNIVELNINLGFEWKGLCGSAADGMS